MLPRRGVALSVRQLGRRSGCECPMRPVLFNPNVKEAEGPASHHRTAIHDYTSTQEMVPMKRVEMRQRSCENNGKTCEL